MGDEQPPEPLAYDEVAAEARRFRFFTKRLLADLVLAIDSGDIEAMRVVMWSIAGHLRPALITTAGLTEYRKPEIADYCADHFAKLKGLFDDAKRKGLLDQAPVTASDATSALETLESHFRFVLSLERPELTRAQRLADSLKRREPDNEDFLLGYRKELGLLGSGLDPYIAQVLLGMRTIDGELHLPGDMVVVRHLNDVRLASFSDDELRAKVLEFARARRDFDRDARPTNAPSREVQFSALDEMEIARMSFSLRWRINVDWTAVSEVVGEKVNPRTAKELAQVLAGCSVEEMGKTAYNHFREQLPRIRKVLLDIQRAQNIKID